ncbi:hypothetical protein PORY_002210 [Pneumocystis oryctolagi]|uniref:Uncharacterized protein n=1 Tax=Pneumocystis oryctolagi TaxID=42067 RepID=A0ACB7CAT5_9ASCO|nr:hypothetical protein PORY_002210 [Pneumocystis oryctolagi]
MENSSLKDREDAIEDYIVSFKAGKMVRDGNSCLVKPDTRKGMVFMKVGQDDLVHFCWKDRITNVIEDDLIIFPDEAEFFRVKESPEGRVFALRFKSSMQIHFFWMQEFKNDKDQYYLDKINDVIKSHTASDISDTNEDTNLKTEIPLSEINKAAENIPLDSKKNFETKTQDILHINEHNNYSSLFEYFSSLKTLLSDISVPDNFSNETFILTDILMPSEIINLLQNKLVQETLFPNLPSDILSQIANLDEKNLENVIFHKCFQQDLRSLRYAVFLGKLDDIILKFSSDNSRGLDIFFRAIIYLIQSTDQEMDVIE